MASVLAYVDLYSFPTSRFPVNVAILAVFAYTAYVIFSWVTKMLLFGLSQERAYRNISADPVVNFVHGHAPYVRDLHCSLLQSTLVVCIFVLLPVGMIMWSLPHRSWILERA